MLVLAVQFMNGTDLISSQDCVLAHDHLCELELTAAQTISYSVQEQDRLNGTHVVRWQQNIRSRLWQNFAAVRIHVGQQAVTC